MMQDWKDMGEKDIDSRFFRRVKSKLHATYIMIHGKVPPTSFNWTSTDKQTQILQSLLIFNSKFGKQWELSWPSKQFKAASKDSALDGESVPIQFHIESISDIGKI